MPLLSTSDIVLTEGMLALALVTLLEAECLPHIELEVAELEELQSFG